MMASGGKLGSKSRRREKLREKLDFKFQFHATRVPNSGWDKLYVSLESTETGKATAKTAKAPVQAGVCRWPDAIMESTRLLHDTKNNSYDAKLYKLVVGTSSTRILGELTLNLADYVSTTGSPTSLALPLKSCSAGTLLHIKVQCLTPWPGESPRDGGEQANRDAQPDGHLSDEDDDGADDSASLVGPQTPGAAKDKVLTRYNSDSSDFSTPGSTTSNTGSGGAPSPATPVNGFNARLERSGRRSDSFSAKPAARGQTGTAGDDLRAEVASLQGNSHKLEQELECLRGLLAERSSQVSERELDISALVNERDGLRTELEQLSRITQERQGGIVVQLEECRHLIGQLQQVLEEEKQTRMRLEVQLKQAEEANMQLVHTADQLEAALVHKTSEAEELVSHNRKLGSSLSEQEQMMAGLEKVLSDKLQLKDEEIKYLQAKCDKLEQDALSKRHEAAQAEQVDGMKTDIEELEADIKELTDENMDLIFKLNMANKELLKYCGEPDYVGMDDLDEKVRLLRKQQDANNERLAMLGATNKQLESSNKELEARLYDSLEEMQSLRAELQASKNMHAMNMETFSSREQKLKARSDEIHEKYAMTFGLVSELEAELDALKKENSQLKSRKEDVESELSSLEMLKSDLVYRLANMEMDNSRLRSQAQKYESQLAERLQELATMESRLSVLEGSLVEGEASPQSRDLAEFVELERQLSLAITSKNELETKIKSIEADKAELGSLVHSQQVDSSMLNEKLESAVGELEEAKVLLQLEVSAREKLEKKTAELSSMKGELEKRAGRAEQEKWQLADRISGLEVQLHYATSEAESYKQQCTFSESRLVELEKEVAELEARTFELDRLRLQVAELEGGLSEAGQERSGLEAKLEQLQQAASKQADEYTALAASAKQDQEQLHRAQLDKSAAVERLQRELKRLTQQLMDGQKEPLASEALLESSRLRREKMELEAELDSYKRKLEESSLRLAQADEEYQRQLLCWEAQKQKLGQENAEVRSREVEMAQLKSESDACVEKLRWEREELEATVQRLDALNAQLHKEKAPLQDKLEELSQSLADLHQLKAAKASLEDKVQSLKVELASREATEAEQRIESMRLRKQNSDLRQKSLEHKEEREELRLKVETMEAELKKRAEASERRHRGVDENGRTPANGSAVLAKSLSKSNVKVYSRDTSELRDRIKVLEGEVKQKTAQAEALSKQIESSANKDEQQLLLVDKLRDQVSVLAHREQELVNSQQLLREEMEQLQQVNMQLQERLAVSKAEPEPMYKEQLACALAAGDVDQVLDNLLWYKRKGREQEAELSDVKERYLNMSLKFAEVEAEREELVMTLRSLKNNNRSRTTISSLLSL